MSDPEELGAEAKRRDAVLREARSLLRRADKLRQGAGGLGDDMASQLISRACQEIEKLVQHLVRLDHRRHRRIDRRP